MMSENKFYSQLEKGNLLSLPMPSHAELERVTKIVAENDGLNRNALSAVDKDLFDELRKRIKHVIFVIKSNESYDPILGDLGKGNGDEQLAWFPKNVTPNQHSLASTFVDADNFHVSTIGAWTGLDWVLSGQSSDLRERLELRVDRGAWVDGNGNNRALDMGVATGSERHAIHPNLPFDPNMLAGDRDAFEFDGPNGEKGTGYLWDAALRAGKSVRNYGSYGAYSYSPTQEIQLADEDRIQEREPFTKGFTVSRTTKPSLKPYSDPYFHWQWNSQVLDYWRAQEWKRELAIYSTARSFPDLSILWLGGDQAEANNTTPDGIWTVLDRTADNDYAFGLVVEALAQSPFAKDTIVIAIEDGSRVVPDHVDAGRSVAFFAGPYIRKSAVVSTPWATVNVLKTIEELLNIGPIGLHDSFAEPINDVFDLKETDWSYKAIVPEPLRNSKLPLP